MSEPKHTPGPWNVIDYNTGKLIIETERGWPVAEVTASRVPGGNENDANARLIATAPALLEAYRGLVRYAEAVRHTAGIGANQLARLEAARAAIAKAEGSAQ